VAIPATIHDVIMARVDSLPEDCQSAFKFDPPSASKIDPPLSMKF
jgi:hypothetical protein